MRAQGIISNEEVQMEGWDGYSRLEMVVGDTGFLNQTALTSGLNHAITILNSGLNYTTTILTSGLNHTIPWIKIT